MEEQAAPPGKVPRPEQAEAEGRGGDDAGGFPVHGGRHRRKSGEEQRPTTAPEGRAECGGGGGGGGVFPELHLAGATGDGSRRDGGEDGREEAEEDDEEQRVRRKIEGQEAGWSAILLLLPASSTAPLRPATLACA